MASLFRITDAATGDELGTVFQDDGWDAFGYDLTVGSAGDGPNGPFDTAGEALDALKAEIGDRKISVVEL